MHVYHKKFFFRVRNYGLNITSWRSSYKKHSSHNFTSTIGIKTQASYINIEGYKRNMNYSMIHVFIFSSMKFMMRCARVTISSRCDELTRFPTNSSQVVASFLLPFAAPKAHTMLFDKRFEVVMSHVMTSFKTAFATG